MMSIINSIYIRIDLVTLIVSITFINQEKKGWNKNHKRSIQSKWFLNLKRLDLIRNPIWKIER